MIEPLMSKEHVSALVSTILVDGFGIIGFAALVLHAFRARTRELREARIADAQGDDEAKIAPGPVVLFGRVEYAQGASTAVRVDIDQDGEEWESSGVWSHKWTEKNRRVTIEPFYLRISKDKRIRVEPQRDVFLVDDMDGLIRVDLKNRTRFAELTPDERIFAAGELVRAHDPEAANEGGGYRTPRESLVLRPRDGSPMLLSSEPLGNRYRARAAFYRRWVKYFAVVAFIFHAIFSPFHLRQLFGETVNGVVGNLQHYTTKDDDGNDVDHYRVWALVPPENVISDHVDYQTFHLLTKGEVIPFRFVNGRFSKASTIGPDVTAHVIAYGVIPLLIGVWLLYRYHDKKSRPWYERDLVDSGNGRLGETLSQQDASSAAKS